MRKNEFQFLEQFTSQYTGEWNPSEGHWLGLDFSHNGEEYRMHTGSMYNKESTILPDGTTALFGLYKKNRFTDEYELLEEYAAMDDLLESKAIDGVPFREVIIAEDTKLLGQD